MFNEFNGTQMLYFRPLCIYFIHFFQATQILLLSAPELDEYLWRTAQATTVCFNVATH